MHVKDIYANGTFHNKLTKWRNFDWILIILYRSNIKTRVLVEIDTSDIYILLSISMKLDNSYMSIK